MLVLTRQLGDTIVISNGDQVLAKILLLKGNNVKLGFEAPADVKILRGEVFDRKYPEISSN